jgi:hypothetical protein
MTIDTKKIVETFERIEEEDGGIAFSDAMHVLRLTAKELGIEVEEARSVMINHWTMGGAG